MTKKEFHKNETGFSFSTAIRISLLVFAIYLFILGIKCMGSGFKMMGKDFSEILIETTTNPLIGLFIGILATSVVQSSSMTTSIVVVMVAEGSLPLHLGIPIVLGANIGTSITNLLVSLAHIPRKEEFKKAFTGAIVHDIFNVMMVIILFPIELITRFFFGKGILEYTASKLSSTLVGTGGMELLDPLDYIIGPILDPLENILKQMIIGDFVLGGLIASILGIILLIGAIKLISSNAKKLAEGKVQTLLTQYVFKITAAAFLFGLILTMIVQSSSVTTSLCIPFIAGNMLTLEQVFPYMLGANIGTTFTTILAALVANSEASLSLAFTHTLFNSIGVIIFLPFKRMRNIPIKLAKILGDYGTRKRGLAILYIVIIFFIIPGFIVLLWVLIKNI